jgi:hypothetical protein
LPKTIAAVMTTMVVVVKVMRDGSCGPNAVVFVLLLLYAAF